MTYRPRPEPLTELEKATLAEWSRRDLAKRLETESDDPIADPPAWQVWRYKQLAKKALDPENQIRPQLARLARVWGLVPKRERAAEDPVERTPPDVVYRFRDISLAMLRLRSDHPLHGAHAHLVEHGVDGLAYLETLEQVAADHGVSPYCDRPAAADACPPAFQGAEP